MEGELMQERDNDRGIGRQTRVRGWKETDPLKYEKHLKMGLVT